MPEVGVPSGHSPEKNPHWHPSNVNLHKSFRTARQWRCRRAGRAGPASPSGMSFSSILAQNDKPHLRRLLVTPRDHQALVIASTVPGT